MAKPVSNIRLSHMGTNSLVNDGLTMTTEPGVLSAILLL